LYEVRFGKTNRIFHFLVRVCADLQRMRCPLFNMEKTAGSQRLLYKLGTPFSKKTGSIVCASFFRARWKRAIQARARWKRAIRVRARWKRGAVAAVL
jgi:hypothetical protein